MNVANATGLGDLPAYGIKVGGGEIIAGDDYSANNVVVKNCVVEQISANQGGNSYGYWVTGEADFGSLTSQFHTILFENCIAQGCKSNIPTSLAMCKVSQLAF